MRYELTDFEWAAIRSFLPNKPRGIPRVDDRRVLSGIFWVLRSGAPWRDLPEPFGNWNSVVQRYRRWAVKGIFERLFRVLSGDPDFEYALIDGTIVRVHQHGTGAKGGPKNRPLVVHAVA